MLIDWLIKLFRKEEPDPMKYLIVGIGNMGAEYDGTRHNIGFDVVDILATEKDSSWKNESLGDISEFRFKGRTFILLKPSTYVNRSGKAVRYWLQKKKIKQENLLVIVDDMNLDFGVLRIRGKGSDGGHNGLKDINQVIGSDYARLRIGIGSAPKGRHVDYVLGPWSEKEEEQLPQIIKRSTEIIIGFATVGINRVMNQFKNMKDQSN
jgi:PTH1 family peptidyl-tRNA hydrolase